MIQEYKRNQAKEYAKKWAYSRNPIYYNFDPVGGDCTSFASQCIYAGSQKMNYKKELGWYYTNGNDKSASWSGVEYLYQFLTKNKSIGPFGSQTEAQNLKIGDIVQLSFDGEKFGHTLVVVETNNNNNLSEIQIASHTYDTYNRNISTYQFQKIRFIHIEGVRI